ncbi:hypothetical protein B0T14DRAFT_189626 [Immersiella caudata]|uniref:Uncharacterized protein n=1 Tax=Immersiella caudata TaxID=314043 RepID=A0AA40C3L5_9PEZI|nr:hypothetical protein B0T14DRAFT_189626 [Immersiella caudata]
MSCFQRNRETLPPIPSGGHFIRGIFLDIAWPMIHFQSGRRTSCSITTKALRNASPVPHRPALVIHDRLHQNWSCHKFFPTPTLPNRQPHDPHRKPNTLSGRGEAPRSPKPTKFPDFSLTAAKNLGQPQRRSVGGGKMWTLISLRGPAEMVINAWQSRAPGLERWCLVFSYLLGRNLPRGWTPLIDAKTYLKLTPRPCMEIVGWQERRGDVKFECSSFT